MTTPGELPAEERLRIALEMADLGIAMMRENLRRRHPGESDDEIERRLVEWLHTRPGAEFGDAEGIPGNRVFLPATHEERRRAASTTVTPRGASRAGAA